jgi:membrane fusion protein (multidrug efflux system)
MAAQGEAVLTDPGSTGSSDGYPSSSRTRIVSTSNIVVLAVTVAAGLWGLWFLYDRLTNTYVLDARVSSDMLLLSSQVSGWIVEVAADESQRVAQGAVLLRIDDRRARGHLAELEAGAKALEADITTVQARIGLMIKRTSSQLDAARARQEAAESELAAVEGDLEVADADWQRAEPLRERSLISQQQFEEMRNTWRGAVQQARRRRADVATARADLAEAEAEQVEVEVLESELAALRERREQAQRQIEQAQTELDYYTITSPAPGIVDEMFVDPGEHVSPGQRVLVMHDPSRLWVKANVKETDLAHLAPGVAVTIRFDAYPEQARDGVIRRIGDAATSQFALLPNPNPSGNFTKITQRLEVTIDFLEHDPRLKPGMMVEVKIPHGS